MILDLVRFGNNLSLLDTIRSSRRKVDLVEVKRDVCSLSVVTGSDE